MKPWNKDAGLDLYAPIGGFNSATAVKPWNTGSNAPHCGHSRRLQFGHGGEAVEYGNPRRKMKPGVSLQFGHGGEAVEYAKAFRDGLTPACFNSATAVKPWNSSWFLLSLPLGCRFNSATAVKPWNSRRKRNYSRGARRASIRPRR